MFLIYANKINLTQINLSTQKFKTIGNSTRVFLSTSKIPFFVTNMVDRSY